MISMIIMIVIVIVIAIAIVIVIHTLLRGPEAGAAASARS